MKRQGIGRHERRPIAERFWSMVDKTGDGGRFTHEGTPCWLWTGSTNGKPGYGIFRAGPERDARGSLKWALAHRFAYEQANGPIPGGFEIDHLCRRRRCVNPAHVQVVTHAVNTLRSDGPTARAARMTECPKGHPFDAKNTTVESSGKRRCRICTQQREKARTVRRREARRAARLGGRA